MGETARQRSVGIDGGGQRAVRLVLGVWVAAAAVLCSQGVASGQQVSITVSPSSAAPGDTVTISGEHPTTEDCPPGAARLTSTADLFPPDGFGPQVPSDASGEFTMSYSIPASTPPGSYRIGMRCGGGNLGGDGSLSVADTTTTTADQGTTTSDPGATATTEDRTTITSAPSTTVPSDEDTGDGGGMVPWIVLAVVVVAGGGVAAVVYVVRRRRAVS